MTISSQTFGQQTISVVLNEGQMPAKLSTDSNGNKSIVDGSGGPLLHLNNKVSASRQLVAFSATLAVDLARGLRVSVGPLTAAITHAVPTNIPLDGTPVIYDLVQDGTGGRGVTWSASHKGSAPTASGTAGQKQRVEFVAENDALIFKNSSGWY